MTPKLNPIDQFIAAKVSARFASTSRRADPIDINNYPTALRSLQAVDPLLGGLKTTSDRYESAAKKALAEFGTAVEKIPEGLRALGVEPKGIQRFHTQLSNLIKVAKKGNAIRAYSTFNSSAPLSKAKKIIVSLGTAALKSSGVGSKILKPALVSNYLTKEVMGPFTSLVQACDAWYDFAGASASKIDNLVMEAWRINPDPRSSGLTLTPEFEKYAEAQREFAKQSRDLLDTVRHNLIGLPMAATGFEDCKDVDLCLATATKAFNECLKLHLDFGKEWGDFRTKNQDQESGQKSLFARTL